MQGKIVKNISNLYSVLVNNKIYNCKPRGKFRNLNITPLVGDEVIIDEENNYILDILPRKNELNRPFIANVDIALILTLDLANDELLNKVDELSKYYESIGIDVFYNNDLDSLKKYLKGKEVVITGQTGAGKSTLINKLGDLNIKTDEISYALGRGKHTTRHVEIYNIEDINIADTPGFSALDISGYSKEEIRDAYPEFRDNTCKFKDCMHNKEKECSVKKLVESNKILKTRYDNYIRIISEV